MNKTVTEGIVFMPPAFADGLGVWSSGDGTPGSPTYAGSGTGAFVPSDPDFAGCLEIFKTNATQQLRYMGQTPLIPGCYLQIKARVKAISGPLPEVRIAGWAGGAGDVHLTGLTEQGPATQLSSYGRVHEITAIVGTGRRDGVDMPWGSSAIYGHFGIDIDGLNGAVVRVDDIKITDITEVFLRDMIGVVDVRDFGAAGDGVTDDSVAFEAADQAANGRRIYVPPGTYFLGENTSLSTEVEFAGTVTMPDDKMLLLTKSYNLPVYIEAFGEEDLAFKKAFQALLNNSDHESLDLGGRKVSVSSPIDLSAAVPNRTGYSTRRVIRNGQFDIKSSSNWDTDTYSSVATYSTSNPLKLTNVANVANIPIGALVQGSGVGREIYVRDKEVGAGEITLNAPIYDAAGTQTFTFSDFKYVLDFSGFSQMQKFGLEGIEIQCNSRCSAIRLAPAGNTFVVKDCFISRPKDRGITSIGVGCQGMLIDGCQFLSSEEGLDVAQRKSIAVNSNANDVKLRHNRASRFHHFAVLGGVNNLILGNHFFQGDNVSDGVRNAGLVMIGTYNGSTIAQNYVDNCSIEWTNERDQRPAYTSGFSFSSMSITDNTFYASDAARWFSFIVVKPYGSGHFLNGVTVTGNNFRATSGNIDRAERVNASFAGLNPDRYTNVHFSQNVFHGITTQCANPLRINYSRSSTSSSWTVSSSGKFPFGGKARGCDSVVARGALRDSLGSRTFNYPYVELKKGTNENQIGLRWPDPTRGAVTVVMRVES